jgi:hypothetical protein
MDKELIFVEALLEMKWIRIAQCWDILAARAIASSVQHISQMPHRTVVETPKQKFFIVDKDTNGQTYVYLEEKS